MNAETEAGAVSPAAAGAEPTRNVRIWRPLTDVVETAEGIVLMMEMPGVVADDVDITLERRVLTVRGRGSSPQPDRLRLVHLEFEPGDYERSFVLSEDFDAARIEAVLKDGVLTLRLPRAAEAQPSKIQVKAA
ncbi:MULTISPECIES: Hsp20/alpha crystallin family protein [Acetobacterales]|uniref:HSP20 family molecular chaperone IbpA n=3 Tax=Acetobacterales TaxID=3120395 RepID=A0A840XXH5_9PROT|nr:MULTISPECIES: Hsp20/alpha crystallin family protein [Acetobacteraceae]MBB5691920.1 HSP20 family molecular chaperone IbpA [Neoroseomonas alkaliterrae]MBW6401407.1 Hsp20/alpha crystallin family protein [Neoroseomonas alba]MCO6415202.1 Hsp20/alpha crystallin family protein [Siccirubricoccus soli]MCP2681333.1 Hsp20/alpha crystallin family protein [Siccirubricoccus soli]SUE63478.1 Spore protein SP21 [Roseomonas gilardii subsp. rosea]